MQPRDGNLRGRAAATPVLWHLEISHYNEKARWALDFKGVAHVRRAVTPGLQELRARRLRAGRTVTLVTPPVGGMLRIVRLVQTGMPIKSGETAVEFIGRR